MFSFPLGNNSDWNDYITRMTARWKQHTCGWLLNGRNDPLHIVQYEKLKENAALELSKIISFCGIKLSEQSRINIGYNLFFRNHTDKFLHFTAEQERYIADTIRTTVNILSRHYGTDSYIIEILKSYI